MAPNSAMLAQAPERQTQNNTKEAWPLRVVVPIQLSSPAPASRLAAGQQDLDLFLDTRRPAAALTQVVQLGTPHRTATLDFNAVNHRAIGLEYTLHTFTMRDFAHSKGRVHATVTLGDAYAFERLQALARPFPHSHLHHQRIASAKLRHLDRGGFNGFFVDLLDDIGHDPYSLSFRCSARYSSMNSFSRQRLASSSSNRANKSGRFSHVRPSACLCRHRSMTA